MKHYLIILTLSLFLTVQTKLKKTVVITSSIKKSKNNHRFVLPVFAAIECTAAVYALIPIIIASLGHVNFCLPAQPELTIEE